MSLRVTFYCSLIQLDFYTKIFIIKKKKKKKKKIKANSLQVLSSFFSTFTLIISPELNMEPNSPLINIYGK